MSPRVPPAELAASVMAWVFSSGDSEKAVLSGSATTASMASWVFCWLISAMGPAVTPLTRPSRPATMTQVMNSVTVSVMMYLGSISTFSLVFTSLLILQPPPC